MTETDWLDCTDARGMLEYQYRQAIADKPALLVGLRLKFWWKARPQGTVSDRKLRLFACACCRSAWDDLDDDTRRVIEVAEAAADRRVSLAELRQAAGRSRAPIAVWLAAETIHEQPSWLFLNWLATGRPDKQQEQLGLLRHVIGNPYRPSPSATYWPSTVVQLANALYEGEDCDFALHDALLDAGHPNLADHFHQEQQHPKGCWAVDLLLDKK